MESLEGKKLEEYISNSEVPVVVSFVSKNCKPCMLMQGTLDEVEKNYSGHLKMVSVDVEEYHELAKQYAVMITPTLIIFYCGKPVLRILGYITGRDLKVKIDEQLKVFV